VLRAAGETEITQENIQDWLHLDEGDREFQLLTEKEIAATKFFYYLFSSALSVLLIFLLFVFYFFLVL
jgi:hypothetical protein